MVYVLGLLIGVVAGLRAMTAPAAVSWAAYLDRIEVDGTWLWFMGYWLTPWIFTVLAVIELVTDQLPSTPSRKVPQQFGARIITGALSGATIGAAMLTTAGWVGGAVAGVIGAIVGTLGGYEARKRLVAATGGRDLPIALAEDAVAIIAAFLFVVSL